GDLETFPRTSEEILFGYLHLVQREVSGVAGENAPFLLHGTARATLEGALDDERADAGRIAIALLRQIRPGEHKEVVGDVGERDPAFLAAQHVATAFLDRGRLNAAGVTAGGWL